MKLLLYILFLAFAPALTSFQSGMRLSSDIETEKYLNYLAAIENTSNFSYFTVIKVKNLQTGTVKEICTKGKFLLGAIHQELNLGYEEGDEKKAHEFAKSKKGRYFEFKNPDALENISFREYNPKLVSSLKTKYKLDELIATIQKEKEFTIRLPDNE